MLWDLRPEQLLLLPTARLEMSFISRRDNLMTLKHVMSIDYARSPSLDLRLVVHSTAKDMEFRERAQQLECRDSFAGVSISITLTMAFRWPEASKGRLLSYQFIARGISNPMPEPLCWVWLLEMAKLIQTADKP